LANNEICVITSNRHLNCAEYRLQARFSRPQIVRVLALYIRPNFYKAC